VWESPVVAIRAWLGRTLGAGTGLTPPVCLVLRKARTEPRGLQTASELALGKARGPRRLRVAIGLVVSRAQAGPRRLQQAIGLVASKAQATQRRLRQVIGLVVSRAQAGPRRLQQAIGLVVSKALATQRGLRVAIEVAGTKVILEDWLGMGAAGAGVMGGLGLLGPLCWWWRLWRLLG
jgi:hypothetical protein